MCPETKVAQVSAQTQSKTLPTRVPSNMRSVTSLRNGLTRQSNEHGDRCSTSKKLWIVFYNRRVACVLVVVVASAIGLPLQTNVCGFGHLDHRRLLHPVKSCKIQPPHAHANTSLPSRYSRTFTPNNYLPTKPMLNIGFNDTLAIVAQS